jgi:hypothetical protein
MPYSYFASQKTKKPGPFKENVEWNEYTYFQNFWQLLEDCNFDHTNAKILFQTTYGR